MGNTHGAGAARSNQRPARRCLRLLREKGTDSCLPKSMGGPRSLVGLLARYPVSRTPVHWKFASQPANQANLLYRTRGPARIKVLYLLHILGWWVQQSLVAFSKFDTGSQGSLTLHGIASCGCTM